MTSQAFITIIICYMVSLLHLSLQIQVYIGLVKIPIEFGTLIIIIFNNHTKELLMEHRTFIAAVVVILYISVAQVLGVAANHYLLLFNPFTVKGEF